MLCIPLLDSCVHEVHILLIDGVCVHSLVLTLTHSHASSHPSLSTMTFPPTGQSTPSAANLPIDNVSVEVDGALLTSGDTVTVTDNVPHLTSVSPSTMACPSQLPYFILHMHHTYSHPYSPSHPPIHDPPVYLVM